MTIIFLGKTPLKNRLKPIVNIAIDGGYVSGYKICSACVNSQVNNVGIDFVFNSAPVNHVFDYMLRQLEWYQKLTAQAPEFEGR